LDAGRRLLHSGRIFYSQLNPDRTLDKQLNPDRTLDDTFSTREAGTDLQLAEEP
jgi:hypothetical protein